MVRAWVDFATSGEPGWQAVENCSDHARIWVTDDGVSHDESTGVRALWTAARFAGPYA